MCSEASGPDFSKCNSLVIVVCVILSDSARQVEQNHRSMVHIRKPGRSLFGGGSIPLEDTKISTAPMVHWRGIGTHTTSAGGSVGQNE